MAKIDIEKLNKDFKELIGKRNTLSELDYNDKTYDDVEEELHDLEDDFQEEYGDFLEKAFEAVHDEFCPDNDVLLPIAYIAKKYYIKDKGDKKLYAPYPGEGVIVEVDNYMDHDTRMVMVPDPVRIVLIIDKAQVEELWRAE